MAAQVPIFTWSCASVAKLGAQREVVDGRVGRFVGLDQARVDRQLVKTLDGAVLAVWQSGVDARLAAVGAKRFAGDVGGPSPGNQTWAIHIGWVGIGLMNETKQ